MGGSCDPSRSWILWDSAKILTHLVPSDPVQQATFACSIQVITIDRVDRPQCETLRRFHCVLAIHLALNEQAQSRFAKDSVAAVPYGAHRRTSPGCCNLLVVSSSQARSGDSVGYGLASSGSARYTRKPAHWDFWNRHKPTKADAPANDYSIQISLYHSPK